LIVRWWRKGLPVGMLNIPVPKELKHQLKQSVHVQNRLQEVPVTPLPPNRGEQNTSQCATTSDKRSQFDVTTELETPTSRSLIPMWHH